MLPCIALVGSNSALCDCEYVPFICFVYCYCVNTCLLLSLWLNTCLLCCLRVWNKCACSIVPALLRYLPFIDSPCYITKETPYACSDFLNAVIKLWYITGDEGCGQDSSKLCVYGFGEESYELAQGQILEIPTMASLNNNDKWTTMEYFYMAASVNRSQSTTTYICSNGGTMHYYTNIHKDI